MDQEVREKYRLAGSIGRKALEFGKSLVEPDALLLDIASGIEKHIMDLGGKPSFPVNISINNEAAHYSPFHGDKKRLRTGDVVNRSGEKPLKLFYETGLVIGNLLKNYAQDMESLSRLSEKLKIKLPLDDLRFHRNKDLWEATVSGAGYGQSSSECLASGLKGFLEAYQMKIKSIEVMAGFVRATFQ